MLRHYVILAAFIVASLPAAAQQRPNFVVIVADDLGWGDLGSYGHPSIRSPNIDRLAADGMRFTDGYAAAPVCSPARAGLLTGRIPGRAGIYDWIPPGSDVHLLAEETTVASLLRRAGYDTCFLGKWHLNGGLATDQPQPDDHGFDHWFATASFAMPTDVALDGSDMTPALTGGTIDRSTPLFWYHYKAWGGPRVVVRDGRWKLAGYWDGPDILRTDSATMRPGDQLLIRSARLIRFELYDVETDPAERRDVAAEHADIVDSMTTEMLDIYGEIQEVDMGWTESWLRRW